MRKMKYAVVLLCLVLLGVLLCGTALADTTQQKKIVYLVLDDSTSMGNIEKASVYKDRWSHANYATQVLAGLMNEGDELRVYFLTQGSMDIDLTRNGIQKSLTALSRMNTNLNTPFEPVNKAQKALKARNPEPGAKYWLVVLADGEFDNGNMPAQEVRSSFEEFVSGTIGNSKEKLQMIYLTIGDSAKRIDDINLGGSLIEKGIYCYHAEEELSQPNNIVSVMGEIADLISGRTRFEGEKLKIVDSKTVQISVDIPLFNFVVLSQNNASVLEKIIDANGRQLAISRSAAVKAPKAIVGNTLSANVYTVDNGSSHIPAGKYTLHFSETVDLSTLAVLFEPALQVKLYKDDPSNVHVGQSFTASAKILEFGTDNVIELSQLPQGSTLTVELKNGSKTEKKSGAEPKAVIAQVEDAAMNVTGTLQIPGYQAIVATEQFQPIPPPKVAATVNGGSAGDVEGNVLTVTTEALKKQTKYMDFALVVDGNQKADPKEMQALGLTVKTEIAHNGLTFPEKGRARFTPCYTEGMEIRDYPLSLCDEEGNVVAEGIVRVKESVFELKPDQEKLEVMEAVFPNEPQTFLFTLYVDGEKASCEDYWQAVRFDELIKGNALDVQKKDGKWSVTASFYQGMTPDVYGIRASVNGKAVAQVAQLQINPSSYVLVNKGESAVTVKEAKFRDQPQSFRFSLQVDGKEVQDIAAYGSAAFKASDDKLVLSSRIENGQYVLDVSWQEGVQCAVSAISGNFNGGEWQELATLTVEESVYEWTVSPDKTVEKPEWTLKDEGGLQIRFGLKADGEKVKAEQLHWYQPVFDINGAACTPAVDGSEWTVQLAPQPVGEYTVHGLMQEQGIETALLVRVVPSQFKSKVIGKDHISIREADFREAPQTFTFALEVDGKEVADPGKYGNFTFAEKDGKLTLPAAVEDGGRRKITLAYYNGMPVDSYTIQASLNGVVLEPAEAVLEMNASDYQINVHGVDVKKGFTFEQAAFASLKPDEFSFRFSLKEDRETLDPGLVQISGWPEKWISTEMKKENELTVYLTGDLTAEAGKHEVVLSYQSASGTIGETKIPVEVVASEYVIELLPDKQMIFNDAPSFCNNQEEFRFNILVGNEEKRKLSDHEMNLGVVTLDVTGADNMLRDDQPQPADSGYTLLPQADAGWSTTEQMIEYSVVCTAAKGCVNETVKEARFVYEYISYSVEWQDQAPISLVTTELKGNEKCLTFKVMAENSRGQRTPLTYDRVNGNIQVTPSRNYAGYVGFETEVLPDGTVRVTPVNKWMIPIHWFIQSFAPAGEMTVTLTFNKSVSGDGMAEMVSGSLFIRLLPWVILFIILYYILIVFILKKRFSRKAVIRYKMLPYSETKETIAAKRNFVWGTIELKPTNFKEWAQAWLPFSLHEYKTVNGTVVLRAARMGRSMAVELLVDRERHYYECKEAVNDTEEVFEVSNPLVLNYDMSGDKYGKLRDRKKKRKKKWVKAKAFYDVRSGESITLYRIKKSK